MSDYGVITEAGAVRFERLLTAPIERVWDYLTQSELRRTWFAGGDMDLRPGGGLTLVFRNSELSQRGEEVPESFREYEGMVTQGEIVLVDPPRRLVFLWSEAAGPPTEVSWELESRGEQTLFVLTHRRLPSREILVDLSGGWHLHIDILAALLAGRKPGPFWATNARYAAEYEARTPADVSNSP
jgi:uncharacterized protein YndB with AHSA1/START domain